MLPYQLKMVDVLRPRKLLYDISHRNNLNNVLKNLAITQMVNMITLDPTLMDEYAHLTVNNIQADITRCRTVYGHFQTTLNEQVPWIEQNLAILENYVNCDDLFFETTRHRTFTNHNVLFDVELYLLRRERVLYGMEPFIQGEQIDDQQLELLQQLANEHQNVLEHILLNDGHRPAPIHVSPFRVNYSREMSDFEQVLIPLLRRRPALLNPTHRARLMTGIKNELTDQIIQIISLHPVLMDRYANITRDTVKTGIQSIKKRYNYIQERLNNENVLNGNMIPATKEFYVELSSVLLDTTAHADFLNIDVVNHMEQDLLDLKRLRHGLPSAFNPPVLGLNP